MIVLPNLFLQIINIIYLSDSRNHLALHNTNNKSIAIKTLGKGDR